MTNLNFRDNMEELKELIEQDKMLCDATLENDYHITRAELKAKIAEKTLDVDKQFNDMMDLYHYNIGLLERADVYGVLFYCDYVALPKAKEKIDAIESTTYADIIAKYGKISTFEDYLMKYKLEQRYFIDLRKKAENLLTFF